MKKIANRVKVSIATAGTGTVTFGAAVSNAYFTPADVSYVSGDIVPYVFVDGTDIEMGFGTIGVSATTMTRDTVRISKIGGTVGTTKLTLSGSAILFIAPAAEDLMFDDLHGADIASASTINLEIATGALINVTGTTGILAVTLSEGHERWVQFTGAALITVGSSLIGNGGGANVTTAAGDLALFVGYAAGVVNFWMIRASGKPIVLPAFTDLAGNITIAQLPSSGGVQTAAITCLIDGGDSVLTTGMKGYIEVPFACTINRATLLGDVSGSIVVDVFKCTYANFAAGTHPVSADKITSATPPTITSSTKSQDSTLASWTTAISAGDILGFNINSVTTIKRVTLSLKVTKT